MHLTTRSQRSASASCWVLMMGIIALSGPNQRTQYCCGNKHGEVCLLFLFDILGIIGIEGQKLLLLIIIQDLLNEGKKKPDSDATPASLHDRACSPLPQLKSAPKFLGSLPSLTDVTGFRGCSVDCKYLCA